jgi:hypothetical protein
MTRKHFRAIAAAIAAIEDKDVRKDHALVMAKICAAANANFKTGLFLEACKVEN